MSKLLILYPSLIVARGLDTFLSEYSEVTISDEKAHPQKDEYDFYVVSSMHYSSNISFFLPRKSRVLIVTEQSDYPQTDELPLTLSLTMNADNIRRGLEGFFNNEEEGVGECDVLSAREIEVLREIARGKTFKEIADALFISVNTVTTHRKNISTKLGIRSVSGLTVYAMMNGIV